MCALNFKLTGVWWVCLRVCACACACACLRACQCVSVWVSVCVFSVPCPLLNFVSLSSCQPLGFKIGTLGKWSNMATKVDVTYKWVGVYASMNIDPIIYMDGLGQVFDGSLNIKVCVHA